MNTFLRKFIDFLHTYLKIEIVGGLIFVVLLLGYIVFTNNSQESAPVVPDSVPTIQK